VRIVSEFACSTSGRRVVADFEAWHSEDFCHHAKIAWRRPLSLSAPPNAALLDRAT